MKSTTSQDKEEARLECEDAFRTGYRDYGFKISINPYHGKQEERLRNAWKKGWLAAENRLPLELPQ